MAAVLDSTCLIGLETIGRLDLIPALLAPVYAPPEVEAEFGSRPGWLNVVAAGDARLAASLNLMVDAGEASAIALALELRARIILDDRKAREVAIRLGVPVTGTIGLLLRAKQAALIPAVKPLLAALDSGGFHIGADLFAEALRLAGE